MSESIFSDVADQAAPVEPVVPSVAPITTPSIPPELRELVGEGKKYRTVEAAIASLPHSQSHISKLEAELQTLRDEVSKRRTTQELLDELKSGQSKGETTPASVNQDDLAAMVERVVSQKEARTVALANLKSVVDSFKVAFPTDAEARYNALASEHGMSVTQFNTLASQSPAMLIKLAGLSKPTPAATPGRVVSDVNTSAFNTNASDPENSSVVNFSKTSDVVDAWRRAGKITRKNLGLTD